jgi:hypothetical protein
MPRPSSPIRITSRSCDLLPHKAVQTSRVGDPADGAGNCRRRNLLPVPADLRVDHRAVVSDLYDQTNPQAVEIDRLRRCLAEVEAQLRASIRDCREKARLLAHTKARLAELEAENEDHRLRIGILQNALRGANTG